METRRILMRSLAVAVVIVSVIWTTTDAEGGEDRKGAEVVYSCCTQVSTAKVTGPIIGVRLQKESLPCVKAIIFETERGKLCSDPKQRWVKEKVKQFVNLKKTNTTSPPTIY